MSIHILPAEVFNRIAAGEVVDRPYSVVKELVENALDAGASHITVEIEGGGKKLIRVTDDGCGISKEDLPRAYLPHATSKLQTAEDLFTVSTLGFRGEAIASIASVSRMSILSNTGEEAYRLPCEGGVLGETERDAGAKGTCVTVEDLFFNTPARLKFLKSDSQEEGDVTNMMARFLLSRPTVSFTYLTNGKVRYRSFGEGLDAALAAVYGTETLRACHAISADKHGVKVYGYIGNRNFSKPNRSYQSLFVNGRYVVNQTVGAAVSNAYAAYLMKRQYPFYVLFVDLSPEIVDVNVHPNKADVRFADNQIVYGSVYSVVSAVLDGNSRALEYIVPAEPAPTSAPSVPSEPASRPSSPSMTYEEARHELAFDVSPVGGRSPASRPVSEERPLEVHSPSAATVVQSEDVFAENQRYLREMQAQQERVDVHALTYRGALFNTYLLYEVGDCVYLVDQHAAHERILFDRLQEKLASRKLYTQPLLTPYLLELNAPEYAFLQKNFPVLRELGFEIGEFGGTSVKISAVPLELTGIDLNAFFAEILSSMESLRAIRLADLLRDKLASAACKAAVKGGESLTEQEVRGLVERMNGDMGLKCPHGRPVAVRIAKTELEKLFKRIV